LSLVTPASVSPTETATRIFYTRSSWLPYCHVYTHTTATSKPLVGSGQRLRGWKDIQARCTGNRLLGLPTKSADNTPSFTGSYMTYGQILGLRESSLCVGPRISKGIWMYHRSSINTLHDVPQYFNDDEYCTSCMHAGVFVCPVQAACSSPTDRTITNSRMRTLLHESPAR
jgi:ferredoxin